MPISENFPRQRSPYGAGMAAGRAAAIRVAAALIAAIAVLPIRDSRAADSDGTYLAATCAACHRPQPGGSAIPSLAGRGERSLVDDLLAFRSGARQSKIMHAVAASLSEKEIARVAHVLATQDQKVAR
jgi:cytochrome c553